MDIIFFVLYVVVIVQQFLAYGTAYRATKRGGDNGVALFGWMFVYGLAAIIPGLGWYLWSKSNEPAMRNTPQQYPQQLQKFCVSCRTQIPGAYAVCPNCGAQQPHI